MGGGNYLLLFLRRRDKCFPVTTAWRVFSCGWINGLQIGMVAANIFNEQSRTPNRVWSLSLVVGRGVKSSWPRKVTTLRNISQCHLEDLGVGGRMFWKWDWQTWTGLPCLRVGTSGGRL